MFLISSILVYSQRDYRYYYTYKGKVSFTNEVNYDSTILRLPKGNFLIEQNIMKNNFPYDVYFDKIQMKPGGIFCETFLKSGPGKVDPRKYLTRVFIDGVMNYKVSVQIGKLEYVKLIDITDILFIIDGNKITIEFPEIRF